MSSNRDLWTRREAAVARGVASATRLFAARAENTELRDVEGRNYIDFAGGIAVVNTGHRHPRVMRAVAEQCEAYTHTAFQVVPYEPYIRLAERLNALAPIRDAKSLFMTTGAEAVENAVKTARSYTGRPAVIAFSGAFHGRSLLTMALTGKVTPYKTGFGPFPAEVYRAPFPIPHHGISESDALAALDRLFQTDVQPDRVAALIIEPVLGEGGFHIAPPTFLQTLRALCDRHGICLICDEIQTGFARTGKLFAIEHSGVEPDLVAVAKGLGGGLPISGVIGRSEIMDAPAPGGLGGTYGGSPLGCAAANAVLDIIEDEKLCERAADVGRRMLDSVEDTKRRNDCSPIGDVRGVGAMVAFDLVKERGGHTPDPEMAKAVTQCALDLGLILLTCGMYGNTIRLLTPLTIPEAMLEDGLERLTKALLLQH